MSEKEKTNSEDEFQDALSDVIEKNSSLRLDDKEAAGGASAGNEGADGDVAEADDNEPKEVLEPDGELSLEELLEQEKDLSPEELEANKEKADKLKVEGNELFKNEEALKAVKLYTDALNICPSKYNKERAVLFGNRAAAKMKLESIKSAIDDCTRAIELYPEYVRALLRWVGPSSFTYSITRPLTFYPSTYRRAKLYEQDDKLDEALADYKRVYEIDPGQREACEAQVRLPPLINERNEKLKTEMLSSLKDLGNMILKPFGLSTANFQMQQDPNSGSYSINFNQNKS